MKKNRGVVLLLVLGTAAIMSILGAVFFGSSFVNQRLAEKERQMARAMHAAEAGIERMLFDLRQDFVNDPDSPGWTDGTINGQLFGPSVAGFSTFPYAATGLNEGFYVVQLRNITGKDKDIWIRSTGTVGEVSQSIRVYATMKNVSIWNNAVFSGVGQGGGYINGHAEMHGSVHLLGKGLAPNENAIELKGGAYMSNNYASKSLTDDLRARLPSIVNDENLETLDAELRVKHGRVSLGGDSSVGAPDDLTNSLKETVDGTFVTDGIENAATSVFSDNGWENEYDLGDTLVYPSLNDPHEGYDSYFDYFDAEALKINQSVILRQGQQFGPFEDDNGNSIYLSPEGILTVKGIVYIKGNLNLGTPGAGGETISYKGKATILVKGSVGMNLTLLAEPSFPQENLIGIMAGETMTLGQDPHTDIMGLFYAEQNISIKKQTNIAGSVVANSFAMDQVPAIFQVPSTLDHLPPHIIGDQPLWLTRVVSWQKE